MALRYDEIELNEVTKETPEGFLEAVAIVTRAGIFEYMVDGKIVRELRPESEVFSAESLKSMQLKPVTVGHPYTGENLTAKTAKNFAVGSVGQNIRRDGKFVKAPFIITDEQAINAVKQGRNKISMGYKVKMVNESGIYEGQPYDAIQTNIRYNHLALVDKGRAGDVAQIKLDSADDGVNINLTKEVKNMTKKIRIDSAEFEVDGLVAQKYDEAINAVTDLTNKTKKLESQIEKLDGEIDALKKQNKELTGRDVEREVMDAAIKRTELLSTIKTCFDEATYEKAKTLSDVAIKRMALSKDAEEAKSLEARSDEYIDARFDAMIEFAKNKNFQSQRASAFGINTVTNTRTTQDSIGSHLEGLVDAKIGLQARLKNKKEEGNK
jgi:uncharacterized protein